MNLIVFGATGQTGKHIVTQALAKGHTVTAAVRTPSKVDTLHDNLTVVQVDALDQPAVIDAVAGHDTVVCAIGGRGLKDTVRSDSTANIIAGMKQHGVERIVIISSLGAGESAEQLTFSGRIFVKTVLKNVIIDHEKQERLLRHSGLIWTSVRPSGLNNGPLTKDYKFGNSPVLKGGQISRADVAHFVLHILKNDLYLKDAITVT